MISFIISLFLFINIALAKTYINSQISLYEYLQCILATSAGIIYRKTKEGEFKLSFPALIFFIGEVIFYFYITAFFVIPYMYQLQESSNFTYLKRNTYLESVIRTMSFFVIATIDYSKLFDVIKK